MDMEKITCEYCGLEFTDRYLAYKQKSTHKARCMQKRYLGGELTIEIVETRDGSEFLV